MGSFRGEILPLDEEYEVSEWMENEYFKVKSVRKFTDIFGCREPQCVPEGVIGMLVRFKENIETILDYEFDEMKDTDKYFPVVWRLAQDVVAVEKEAVDMICSYIEWSIPLEEWKDIQWTI